MEVIPVSVETDKSRMAYLSSVFGQHEGYVCVAYGSRDRKKFREEFFRWPDDAPEALALINKVYQGHNVWFCPHLFDRKARKKEYVSVTPCSWSDLDTCQPDELLLDPTVLIESSPGRWQALWMYERPIDSDDAENVSQRIAYKHADAGADRSGWDLTQLLRMPYTYNYKYASTPIVEIRDINRKRYRLDDFKDLYPQIAEFAHIEIPMPEPGDIPDGTKIIEDARFRVTPMVWRLFQEEHPTEDSWSENLWKLEMMLFEAGFDRETVFSIARDAKCNKYKKKGMSEHLLWKEVCRAEAKHIRDTQALAPKDNYTEEPLITDDERRDVEREETFIERYITWAKSLGDAAPQYHQAGAFTALSSLLAGNVQLPTSFGTMKPNLWFMILADTTLTRKSTAMDISMDIVTEIDPEAIMATDGSIEGLLTSLSTRPSRPSVFLRDEFSGLLEMITKKDYYAGMPELLTKLYDGKMQKRILRKETIDVRDPCLIVFAGGIKNKITSLLTFDQVSSGFMPRFIFITAESDITKVRPLGPPTEWTDNNRQAIFDELSDLADFYQGTTTMVVNKLNVTIQQQKKFDAFLTPEAWYRYNELETQLLDAGMHSQRPDIMTPTYDRLAKSILKASVLLAASRQKEERIKVEKGDIVRAAAYGESWRMYVREIMNSVGKGQGEKLLDNIYGAICRHPGVARSYIMQSYHLNARETSQAFETLEQRNLITRQRKGKSETLFPTTIIQETLDFGNLEAQ